MEFSEAAVTVHPPSAEPGYRVGQLLGAGRTGRVWLAVRERDGGLFALKIPAAAAGGAAGAFVTRRELNILTRFEHENLLRLHTVLETDQGPGLLLEYAPGETLARLAGVRGALRPGEAVTVLVGIASALEYLHDQGVAHGEVSPGNILFTAQGKPVLGHLGTARLYGFAEGAGAVPGSPAAPEAELHFRADPAAAFGPLPALPEADIHALAAVGWLVLTGQNLPPQEHRPRLDALVPGIPPSLAEAVEAGLEEDPARRPGAAAFARLVFDSAAAEPLELALPAPEGAGHGMDTRRARSERSRAVHGLRGRGGHGKYPGRTGADRDEPRRRPRGLLFAAAALVAGTTGLGAVAVAAPELLQPPRTEAPDPGGAAKSPADAADAVATAAPGQGQEQGIPAGSQPGEPGDQADQEGPGQPAEPAEPAEPTEPTEPAKSVVPDYLRTAEGDAGPGPGPLAGMPEPELQTLLLGDRAEAAAGALAELRARAFSAADAGLLTGVNLAESAAMAADRAEIAKLEAAGTVLSGLAVELLTAGPPLPGEAGRVMVPAAVSTSAYAEREAGGGMIRRTAESSRQDILLVMVRTPEGWRVEDILPAPS